MVFLPYRCLVNFFSSLERFWTPKNSDSHLFFCLIILHTLVKGRVSCRDDGGSFFPPCSLRSAVRGKSATLIYFKQELRFSSFYFIIPHTVVQGRVSSQSGITAVPSIFFSCLRSAGSTLSMCGIFAHLLHGEPRPHGSLCMSVLGCRSDS